jgi:hypothetical protein
LALRIAVQNAHVVSADPHLLFRSALLRPYLLAGNAGDSDYRSCPARCFRIAARDYWESDIPGHAGAPGDAGLRKTVLLIESIDLDVLT